MRTLRPSLGSEPSNLSRRDVLGLLTVVPSSIWIAGCASSASQSPNPATEDGGVVPEPQNTAAIPGFDMTIEGDVRVVRAKGLPNHATGTFPNAHDPEPIHEQAYVFRMPLAPKKAADVTDLCPLGQQTYLVGVAVNGVPFDPSGPWYQGGAHYDWHFEATSTIGAVALGLDENHAHTQNGGRYHYHGVPTGLVEALRKDKPTGMLLLGYAADGFPIYAADVPKDPKNAHGETFEARTSFRLRQGTRPTAPGGAFDGTFEQDYEYVAGLGDLDACNGREGVTPEYPNGTYYYVITNAYPFMPRQFRGTPDASFFYGPKGAADAPGGSRAPMPPELRNYKP